MHRYIQLALLGTALAVPGAVYAQEHERAPEQTRAYQDSVRHDSHEWNEAEDRAYRRYLQEHHKKYHAFEKASKKEQQDYWKWRHDHPDKH